MEILSLHSQVLKDLLKRKYVDFVARGDRLRTPMGTMVLTLQASGRFPSNIAALELFGMHGLWLTKDYANFCGYLELYEVNAVYAHYARKFLPHAVVINADSIAAVKNGQLRRPEYNFIVSDNPFASPYGGFYYEHFDFFPDLVKYIRRGILQVNFTYNIVAAGPLSATHLERREMFYGKAEPSLGEALQVYEKLLHGRKLVDYIFLPQNARVGLLALVLEEPAD